MTDHRGRRPTIAYVSALAAVMLAASGCASDDPVDAQYYGICVDEQTQERLPDERCGDWDDEGQSSGGGTFFMWISSSYGGSAPAVGHRVPQTIGSRRVPAGSVVTKGVPMAGGSIPAIKRGGLGIAGTGKSGGS